MADHIVGRVDDFRDGAGQVVELGGRSIGVFRHGDDFYALINRCAHQAGPLGEGGVFPTVRAEAAPGVVREWFDREAPVVACPWHGWEFDLKTGVCLADRARRVMTYPVAVKDGQVVVTMPDRAPASSSTMSGATQ